MKRLVMSFVVLMLISPACFAGIFGNSSNNNVWEMRKQDHLEIARQKLLQTEDICDVCGKSGKSKDMYRAIKYGTPYYEGEFLRVHEKCLTSDYRIIEKPAGAKEISWKKLLDNKIKMQRIEIARLFPFLDILDELIDWTSSITFYKVKNKENKKIYEIYKWEGTWQTREKQKDGKYLFNEKLK